MKNVVKIALVVCALASLGSSARAQVHGGVNGYGNASQNISQYGHVSPAYTEHHHMSGMQNLPSYNYSPRVVVGRSTSVGVLRAPTNNCCCKSRTGWFRR